MFSISFNPKEIWCRMKLRNQLILVRMLIFIDFDHSKWYLEFARPSEDYAKPPFQSLVQTSQTNVRCKCHDNTKRIVIIALGHKYSIFNVVGDIRRKPF